MPVLDIGWVGRRPDCPEVSTHRPSSREHVKRCDFDAIDTLLTVQRNGSKVTGVTSEAPIHQLAARQPKPPVVDTSALVTTAEACRYPFI
jgi:hypothetical protein